MQQHLPGNGNGTGCGIIPGTGTGTKPWAKLDKTNVSHVPSSSFFFSFDKRSVCITDLS